MTEGGCRDDLLKNAAVTEEEYFVAPPGRYTLKSEWPNCKIRDPPRYGLFYGRLLSNLVELLKRPKGKRMVQKCLGKQVLKYNKSAVSTYVALLTIRRRHIVF